MIRRTISYLFATAVLSGLSALDVPVQPAGYELSPPEQAITLVEASYPRKLTISVSVHDPEDLKVVAGVRVEADQLLADRGRERRRLEAQAKQLDLALHRLEVSSITAPLPPATRQPILEPTYLEQTAAIASAETSVQQAESSIQAKQQEIAYLEQLPNLDPLIFEHESANLAELKLEHTAAIRNYQLALGKRSTAEYEHSRAMAIDISTRNRDQLSYQSQWAQYEQRLRDRDFQLAQTQLRLDEVENAIANLAVIRSPYAGRIRRIKWLGQGPDGMLSAEISLMVRAGAGRRDDVTVPGQFNAVPGNVDSAGDQSFIRD